MTSVDASRPGDDGTSHSHDSADPPEIASALGSDRSIEALRAENDRLAQRVADLEMTVVEYRSQMSTVLSSASWRVTSPLRAAARRVRTARSRARRAARRMRSGAPDSAAVLTAGLFPPPVESLPEFSPLRRGYDPMSLVRAPMADGPVSRPVGSPRVLVVAHVHYPELWGDIEDRLARVPMAFDLIVTVTEGAAEAVLPDVLRRHPHARIDVVANRGRDWASLISLANEGALSGYEAIAKVHTKKSEHRLDGDGWRLALLDGIFESPDAISRVVDLLTEDRSVGLVVPTGHVAGPEHWGSDRTIVEALASRLPMAFDPDRIEFPGGSMFWCRPWLLERLADLCLTPADFESEAGQYDGTTAHALERLVGLFVQCGGMDVVEAMDVAGRLKDRRRVGSVRPRVLAFYLPQYHQTAENDAFWGEGFTDWVNVRKAEGLAQWHRQPILPADEVGFYDLDDPEVMRRQAGLAREYGIDGFVFHHYWFDGRKVLDRPMKRWLEDPDVDLPIALCWANESWTRRWDGLDRDVLIEQTFSPGWEGSYVRDIAPYLADPRYIRVDGRPLLIIYRADQIPDTVEALARVRAAARECGLGAIHVLLVQPSRDFGSMPEGAAGAADGVILFPPGSGLTVRSIHPPQGTSARRDHLVSYEAAAREVVPAGGRTHPTVMPGWDNTARRGSEGYVFVGASPVSFRGWIQRVSDSSPDADLLLVNAWNEWAEGAAVEPSKRFGRGNLGSLRDCVSGAGRGGARRSDEGR